MTRDEAVIEAVASWHTRLVGGHIEDFYSDLRRAGFAIVPREPTEKMVVNGDEAAITRLQDHSFALKDPTLATLCYVAMIAAYEKEQGDD